MGGFQEGRFLGPLILSTPQKRCAEINKKRSVEAFYPVFSGCISPHTSIIQGREGSRGSLSLYQEGLDMGYYPHEYPVSTCAYNGTDSAYSCCKERNGEYKSPKRPLRQWEPLRREHKIPFCVLFVISYALLCVYLHP